jgi:uridine kinase
VTQEDLNGMCSAILSTPVGAGRRARLVAISGIDASGKGYISSRIEKQLTSGGERVALIGIDGWLNLPATRFADRDRGAHFYRHAFRFSEMLECLVDPLVRDGSVDYVADFTDETASAYRKHRYRFHHVDTVLLEGIFLLRRDLQSRYDLRVWVECSFEAALERAIARSQEGLSKEETIHAYEDIYFPAQRLHFDEDQPQSVADIVFDNEANQQA